MGNKIIIFLSPRGGTKLLFGILQGIESGDGVPRDGMLCLDSGSCKLVYLPGDNSTECLSADDSACCWWTHVGDWWGGMMDVPSPYDGNWSTRWGVDELKGLPSGSWKFIYLVRDMRNQIESFRSAILTDPNCYYAQCLDEWGSKNVFEVLCKSVRNRARVAIDCDHKMGNYKIFKFEELAANPFEVISEMYNWMGMVPDVYRTKCAISHIQEPKLIAKHSHFGDCNFNERYLSWNNEEKAVFKEIAGRELIDLGYEKDDNW